MTRTISAIAILTLGAMTAAAAQDDSKEAKREEKRQAINAMTDETVQRLLAEHPGAKRLFDQSYGYAVFDNLKLSLLFASEKGNGAAIEKGTGERTYMRMGSLGLNVGLGGQKMQVVFLFQNKETYDRFVNKGWRAESSADAAAGTKGASADVEFIDGIASFQFTEKGLMLQADISGTKYWKNDKLN